MPGLLTLSPADVLRRAIIQLGLGVDPGPQSTTAWQVFAHTEPDLPNEVITVYDTTGRDLGYTMVDGQRQTLDGIQIRVRANDEATGWTKANAIAVALDAQAQLLVVISSSVYKLWEFNRTSGPVPVGRENAISNRRIHTVNGTVSLRQLS